MKNRILVSPWLNEGYGNTKIRARYLLSQLFVNDFERPILKRKCLRARITNWKSSRWYYGVSWSPGNNKFYEISGFALSEKKAKIIVDEFILKFKRTQFKLLNDKEYKRLQLFT